MHENNSYFWHRIYLSFNSAATPKFIIHRGIGNRTPYHLMFGQHPKVGISSLLIVHEWLQSLATETEVTCCLGLENDVPLEDARLISSMPTKSKEKSSPEKSIDGKVRNKTKSTKKTGNHPLKCIMNLSRLIWLKSLLSSWQKRQHQLRNQVRVSMSRLSIGRHKVSGVVPVSVQFLVYQLTLGSYAVDKLSTWTYEERPPELMIHSKYYSPPSPSTSQILKDPPHTSILKRHVWRLMVTFHLCICHYQVHPSTFMMHTIFGWIFLLINKHLLELNS